MPSFIEKERIRIETRRNEKEQRRIDKEARYRAWLENPTRYLPEYEKLAKYRKWLVYGVFISMFCCSIEVLFLYDTCWIGDFGFPIIFISLAWIFTAFALMFDYGIYRRWDGKKPYYFNWKGY